MNSKLFLSNGFTVSQFQFKSLGKEKILLLLHRKTLHFYCYNNLAIKHCSKF